jgi:hypothetical protein
MLWFTIHNILKTFSSMENQTRNLTTFLTGTVLYVLFYSYAGSFDFIDNSFLKNLFGFFIYIIIADGFAMAILYKNFYKQTIFTEVKETLGSKMPAKYDTSDKHYELPENIQQLLQNNSNDIDENEGFAKQSALGDNFSCSVDI